MANGIRFSLYSFLILSPRHLPSPHPPPPLFPLHPTQKQQMTAMLDLMESYLDERGVQFCRIDGSVNYLERQEAMRVRRAALCALCVLRCAALQRRAALCCATLFLLPSFSPSPLLAGWLAGKPAGRPARRAASLRRSPGRRPTRCPPARACQKVHHSRVPSDQLSQPLSQHLHNDLGSSCFASSCPQRFNSDPC